MLPFRKATSDFTTLNTQEQLIKVVDSKKGSI